MKKLHLWAALFIFSAARSQTTYTWTGANNGSWATAANWSPTRTSPATSDILQFNDGTSKTITSVPSQTIGKLLLSNNTIITLNAASANRTVTIGNSTGTDLVIAAGSSLTIGTGTNFIISVTNNATADISGTLVVNNGRTYATNTSGTTTTVSATGLIQNSGTVNSTNANRLSFLAGARYEHTQNGGTIPTATWDDASTAEITGIAGNVPSGLNQSFGNFTWDCPAQNATINFNGGLTTVNGNFTVANTNTNRRIQLGSNDNVTLNIGGNITIGSAGNTAVLDMDANNGNITINLTGDLITLGNGQIDNVGNNNATFNFIRPSGVQNINLGNANSFVDDWGGNINIGNGSQTNSVVLQSNLALAPTYLTNIDVNNGSTFDMGPFVISNRGTFSASAGSAIAIGHAGGISPTSTASGNVQVSGAKTYNASATYSYTGSVAQVTGAGLPAAVTRLVINNTSGTNTGAGVSLSQATAITGSFALNNGYLQTTATNIITVNNGATITTSGNSFVTGPIRKIGNSNFTFPTGWAGVNGGLIPISISALSASATVQAEYKRLPSATVGTSRTTPLHHVSGCEYWELFPTTGSVNATITMNWNSYSNCSPVAYVNQFASLVIARSNGTTWASVGNTGGSMGSGTIISTANTTMSIASLRYFSLGSISAGFNPLPVLFTTIKAFSKNNGVQVEWTNLTEKDILHYTIQRSANAKDFVDIDSKLPANNQGDRADYSGFDGNALNGVSYYRIRATETSGRFIYSKTVRIETSEPAGKITIYPNPVIGRDLNMSLTGLLHGQYTIQVFNPSGQAIYKAVTRISGNSQAESIVLPASITPGMYFVLISGDNYRQAKSFLVQ